MICLILSSAQALAVTLNFNTIEPGITNKTLEFPTAAISASSGGALFVYGKNDMGMSVGPQVCALQSGFSCTGDISLLFIGPVSNLTFKGYYAATSDKARISVYSGDDLVSYALVSGNPTGEFGIDFTGVSGITRVEIADFSSASSNGIAYGGITFDIDESGDPNPDPLSVLGFDAFESGVNQGSLDLGQASIRTTNGDKTFVYRSGDFGMAPNGGICAYTTDFNCMGDFLLEFDQPIFDLTFSGFFAKITDSVLISLFDGDELIYSGQYFGNGAGMIFFDFSQFTKLTKIFFEDASDPLSKGIAYGDFRYRLYADPDTPVPVPIPTPLLLLLAGLVSLSLLRLRSLAPSLLLMDSGRYAAAPE